MAPVGLALMIGATTTAARNGSMLPRWLVRAGAVLSVGLVSPTNFLFVLPAFFWIAVVGSMLGRTRAGAEVPRAPAPGITGRASSADQGDSPGRSRGGANR
ncbi:MAG TPA: hypothetical protein VMQ65_06835 [Candidatus Limnocylindria bacterium]|nr:hypothetical protein [Candidatus Limnocylindria bacterium]